MDPNNILSANMLDILFEGRNKEYGAYDLRKTYNKRISISLVLTMGIIAALLIPAMFRNHDPEHGFKRFEVPDAVVKSITPAEPPPPPILPPPPPVATIAFPPPLIVNDALVVKPPPEIRELLGAKIDVKTIGGAGNIDYVAPPLEISGTQVMATPGKKQNEDSRFIPIEINASFPGGDEAWLKFIKKEIERSIDEFTEADFGTCTVKFMVDKTGAVSNVEAITMKGTKLAGIATNAIRQGPRWIPAQQNGAYVNAYRLQPVTLNNLNQ